MKKALILGIILFFAAISQAGEKEQKESTIYGKDGHTQEYIRKDSRGKAEIYDRNWERKGFIRDGVIYDKNWNREGYIKDGLIYDKNWNRKGYVRENKTHE